MDLRKASIQVRIHAHCANGKFLKVNQMTKTLFLIFITITATANAVTLPTPQRQLSVHFEYEPLCNEKRQQVQVRLIESTNFLVINNVKTGTVLYGVRFKSVGLNRPSIGVVFCEPYETKSLTFWDGYRANQNNQKLTAFGVSQCLVDVDEDGFFDDASVGYIRKPAVSVNQRYKYETIPVEGAADISCPRQKPTASAVEVNEYIWNALTESERTKLKILGEIDVVPMREVGLITSTQRLDRSSPGGNAGAVLGESLAAANYIDKSVNNGNYSARGQLGAQVLGAVLGSTLDAAPQSSYLTRYTVKLASGELVSVDKPSRANEFSLATGMCITVPSGVQTKQALCDTTLAAFREMHFGKPEPVMQPQNSREVRLRELKRLFDEGLLSEPVYLDQQQKVLSN
jgi:hypothetical protein